VVILKHGVRRVGITTTEEDMGVRVWRDRDSGEDAEGVRSYPEWVCEKLAGVRVLGAHCYLQADEPTTDKRAGARSVRGALENATGQRRAVYGDNSGADE
jgi:hypothetical protein